MRNGTDMGRCKAHPMKSTYEWYTVREEGRECYQIIEQKETISLHSWIICTSSIKSILTFRPSQKLMLLHGRYSPSSSICWTLTFIHAHLKWHKPFSHIFTFLPAVADKWPHCDGVVIAWTYACLATCHSLWLFDCHFIWVHFIGSTRQDWI